MSWPSAESASEATTKNQPPETDIIMFQIRFGIACGSSRRQNRFQGPTWYMRAASWRSSGTVLSDWYRLNVMFQAWLVKIAKIAAHSGPSRLPGNSLIQPVIVMLRKERIGIDWRMSRIGIRIFSAIRLFAAAAA